MVSVEPTLVPVRVTVSPAAALLGNERGTVIEAVARMPVISVSVPSSAGVVINPFQFPVEIEGENKREQIICTPAVISSSSDIPLKVSVTVTGTVTPESDMTLATAPTGGTGTVKSAFVYFEIVQSSWGEVRKSLWATAYDPAKHLRIISGAPQTGTDMLTLSPLNKFGEIAKGGYAQFRLAGDAVRNPANEWNEKDGIDVMVAFTFTPVSYVEP